MNVAVYLAHPSQYYVLREPIRKLREKDHTVFVFIKSKDMLVDLLREGKEDCINLSPEQRSGGIWNLVFSVAKRNLEFFRVLKTLNINLVISAASDISQPAFLRGIPAIILNDDDAAVIKKSALFGWPFSSVIFSPESCNMGYWRRKTIFYKGYQKLFYLHPRYFRPDASIAKKYVSLDRSFFIIRSVSLTAHHDKNVRGLSNGIVKDLIETLEPFGDVLISSERTLPKELETYRLHINPLDMHQLLYHAKLLIGDSQSMAHEAAIIGTPSIRFNDFVGRIGVLEELEHRYGLTFGVSPDEPDVLIQKSMDIAKNGSADFFRDKARVMLTEMIDPAEMLVWFVENYPESEKIMRNSSNYQYRFQ